MSKNAIAADIRNEIREIYNSLGKDVLEIAGFENAQTRINQLLIEKHRLKKRFAQSIKEINAHIKNLEDYQSAIANKRRNHVKN